MGVFQFKTEQRIPATKNEVWDFISSPSNLREITPDKLDFTITSPNLPDKMYTGLMITYKVRPILGIRMTWVTEITHVQEGKYFVDEQRVGPYAIWHHEHHIEEIDGGISMKDIITYKPPFGFLGNIANRLLIRKQLKEIFQFREKAIIKRFGNFGRES